STSRSSSSARRLTAPSRSRSRRSRSRSASTSATSGIALLGSMPARLATSAGSISSISRICWATSPPPPLPPSQPHTPPPPRRAAGYLAGGAHGFEERAGGAAGLGERVLALGELISGGAALRLRGFDLADERAPPLFERARGILEARALGLGLFHARFERGDLRRRAVVARAPGLAGRDRPGQPPPGDL